MVRYGVMAAKPKLGGNLLERRYRALRLLVPMNEIEDLLLLSG